ncbi:MAG: saccharopine dehydrogenase NADP-binding domain-containing protein, partial [Bacteroidia bacterium]|nr:saccharopine dehydrogenase NADP-binding domain-containing protein [Bacteroidia bacterium]
MRNILIVGAGKSSSYLVKYLLDKAPHESLSVTIGDINTENVKKLIGDSKHARAIQLNVFDDESRSQAIKNADIVVSMLPARYHFEVAKDCVKYGKHLVTASYVSKEMRELDDEVKSKGLVFMNEIGVDPGIDHMSAMQVIDRIRKDG